MEIASEDAIESCQDLYLLDIRETRDNSLRLVLGEAFISDSVYEPPEVPELAAIREHLIGHPIEVNAYSRIFVITWRDYLGYAVISESRATAGEDERTGRRFYRYGRSRFRDFITHGTWDNGETMLAWGVSCLNHCIDVASHSEPDILLYPYSALDDLVALKPALPSTPNLVPLRPK